MIHKKNGSDVARTRIRVGYEKRVIMLSTCVIPEQAQVQWARREKVSCVGRLRICAMGYVMGCVICTRQELRRVAAETRENVIERARAREMMPRGIAVLPPSLTRQGQVHRKMLAGFKSTRRRADL